MTALEKQVSGLISTKYTKGAGWNLEGAWETNSRTMHSFILSNNAADFARQTLGFSPDEAQAQLLAHGSAMCC